MKERTFETIVIRPSWKYYALNMGWLALLSMVLLFIGGMDGVIFHLPLYVASGVIGAFALYQFLYLKKIIFFVTNEQLIVQRGVFLRTWDYIELYRIIDFTESKLHLTKTQDRKSRPASAADWLEGCDDSQYRQNQSKTATHRHPH